jgi:hypothetical protein
VGEINKEITTTKTVTVTSTYSFKWIQSTTEPAAPEGYERAPELDINLGDLGKLWAYLKIS